MQALQSSIEEQKEALRGFREQEVALLQEKQRLQQAAEEQQLTVQRQLSEARGTLREEARKQFTEEHRLKDLEKDATIHDLKRSLDSMKQRMEQGSMERQGEALERSLEEQIRRAFQHDEVRPVPKGIRGADVLQLVRTGQGRECGAMLWESKNTKNWSLDWIPKLKQDAIAVSAHLSLLVSVVLPPGVERFGEVDGVWVCDPASAIPLATALRQQLLAVEVLQQANAGRTEKMDLLYTYLSGVEFRQKVQAVVEGFVALQKQVAKERRAMEAQWKLREKLIERVLSNTAGFYGDLQGIIGQSVIGPISELEMDDPDAEPLQLTDERTPELPTCPTA
jgi:hypothetical protein